MHACSNQESLHHMPSILTSTVNHGRYKIKQQIKSSFKTTVYIFNFKILVEKSVYTLIEHLLTSEIQAKQGTNFKQAYR